MFELSGKTAWVTGSARNLGKAMVDDLASQGANVVISNKSNDDELNETVENIDKKYDAGVYGVQLDISEPDSVEDAFKKIKHEFGGVDILVNNAAIRPHVTLDDLTLEKWQEVLNVNQNGAYNCTMEVLPNMMEQEWGRIINISGIDAMIGVYDRLPSVTANAGLMGFTRSLAQTVGRFGITSNCVAPGVFDTSRDAEWYPNIEKRYEIMRSQIPLKRIGTPDDISPMIVFLASDESSFITGQTIHVNGGHFPTFNIPDPDEFEAQFNIEDILG